jgi:hypothetical protein
MTATKNIRQTSAHRDDWAELQRAYSGVAGGVIIFAADVLAVLLILAWVVSDTNPSFIIS